MEGNAAIPWQGYRTRDPRDAVCVSRPPTRPPRGRRLTVLRLGVLPVAAAADVSAASPALSPSLSAPSPAPCSPSPSPVRLSLYPAAPSSLLSLV